MIPTVERILFLHKIPLFESFSVDQLWQVAQALEEVSFEAGETVFAEGTPANALYLIVSGEVAAVIGGREVARIGKESVLGDVAVLDGMPYAITTTARSAVVAIRIEREKLDDILDANPGAARGVIRVLCRKLRHFSQRIIEAHQGKKIDSDMDELLKL